MFKHLTYHVQFSNGKSLKGDFQFEKGLTAITGANEAGKSMSLEMGRYMLFGSGALRGKATSYKKIEGSLVFLLRGEEYEVTRSGSKAELFGKDGQIASGTKPVNEAIIRLFGYGLDVFDVANNCAQGEIESIGNMKPTERKALIDQTIGLNAIDDLADYASDELSAERKAVEVLEASLVKPEEPEKPEGYRPMAELNPELETSRQQVQELHSLRGWLGSVREEPKAPGPAPCDTPLEMLTALQRRRQDALQKESELKQKIARIPTMDWTQEKVDEERAKHAHNAKATRDQRLLTENPRPEYNEEDCRALETALAAKKLDDEITRLDAKGHAVCPACGSDFPHEHEAIETIKAERAALGAEVRYDLIGKFDPAVIRYQLQKHEAAVLEVGEPRPLLDVTTTPAEIEAAAAALKVQDQLPALKAELGLLDIPADQSKDLAARAAWEAKERDYQTARASWDAYVAERAAREARAKELEGVEALHQALTVLAHDVQVYDRMQAVYDKQIAIYEKAVAKIATHRERVDQLERVRKALRELKVRIKGHLLPSLNKVSSTLLSTMTGGARNQIIIDESFEIEVDGQPLATLSGSGKACVNLAIRIGLGQVLTNKVFSVFMADEIDAAMDQNRAEYTAECLQNLTASIGQIILVSHKTINAQHHIEVSNGQSRPIGPVEGSDRE